MATKFVGFFLVRIRIYTCPSNTENCQTSFSAKLWEPLPTPAVSESQANSRTHGRATETELTKKNTSAAFEKKNLSRFLRERRGGRKNKEEGGIKGKIGGERSWQRATNKQFLPNSPFSPLLSSKGILPIPHLGPVAPSLGGEYPDTQRNTQQQRPRGGALPLPLQLCMCRFPRRNYTVGEKYLLISAK